MKLHLKNIWKIKEANVKLDWLTVIAWNNSTWKSTFSKSLYSVIKTIYKDYKYHEDTKIFIIKDIIRKIFLSINVFNDEIIYLDENWFDKDFIEEEKKKQQETMVSYNLLMKEFVSEDNFFNEIWEWKDFIIFLDNKIKFINDFLKSIINPPYFMVKGQEKYCIDNIPKFLNKIKYLKNVKELSKEDIFRYIINDELNIDFKNNQSILLSNNDKNVFYFNWESIVWKVNSIWINDITIIETPMFLWFLNSMKINWLIDHNTDLLKKLQPVEYPNKESIILDNQNVIKDIIDWKTWKIFYFWNNYTEQEKETIIPIWIKIKQITGFFSEVEKKIWYTKEEILIYWEDYEWLIFRWRTGNKKSNFSVNQMASWIKSFSILQLLEQWWNLNNNNLIVLDEPESHLHPEWQLKYAEVVCEMVKKWVKVVINSHSPYMIEALNKISIRQGLIEKSNFYLTKENSDWTVIFIDKTEEKYDIFSTLSEPFNKLMFM